MCTPNIYPETMARVSWRMTFRHRYFATFLTSKSSRPSLDKPSGMPAEPSLGSESALSPAAPVPSFVEFVLGCNDDGTAELEKAPVPPLALASPASLRESPGDDLTVIRKTISSYDSEQSMHLEYYGVAANTPNLNYYVVKYSTVLIGCLIENQGLQLSSMPISGLCFCTFGICVQHEMFPDRQLKGSKTCFITGPPNIT